MLEQKKPKVICIGGPTASGKTDLAIKLAKKINGEIISADSMQIYRGLNIGTAKVTKEEMENIPHHLIDIVDMDEEFSVADYKKMCYEKIEEILKRGKVPIIVGGTGLYISSVIFNMEFREEKKDDKYREELYRLAKENSNEYVHNMLKQVDASSAMDIHPNNLKRVIRALEMYRQNIKKSEYIENEKKRISLNNVPYDFTLFCLVMPRDVLSDRINKRVDIMVQNGLEKEARLVYKLKKGTARQATGYKEMFDYFEHKKTLSDAIGEIKLRTRQYAKRQMTWFKKMPNVHYIDMLESKEENLNKIMEIVYERNSGV